MTTNYDTTIDEIMKQIPFRELCLSISKPRDKGLDISRMKEVLEFIKLVLKDYEHFSFIQLESELTRSCHNIYIITNNNFVDIQLEYDEVYYPVYTDIIKSNILSKKGEHFAKIYDWSLNSCITMHQSCYEIEGIRFINFRLPPTQDNLCFLKSFQHKLTN